MTFLIDGYNLMHAIGSIRQGLPAGQLLRARKQFLEWLADVTAGRSALIRVVFDAHAAPAASPESDHRGVKVRFAFRRTADDEIEELLATKAQPGQITVVSNDARVREAGRRRSAATMTCEQFVDWTLEVKPELRPAIQKQGAKKRQQGADAPRSPTASADEMAAWLAAFSTRPRNRRKP